MPSGWVGSNRRSELPPDWPIICLRILLRDHHRCQHVREDTGRKCGRRASSVDHITPHSQGGTDDDSNLQALCDWHHGRKTGIEGGTASGVARRAKRDASKPIHPGLITPEDQPAASHDPAPF
jgi:5-methylcytosine-specific restriction protein A